MEKMGPRLTEQVARTRRELMSTERRKMVVYSAICVRKKNYRSRTGDDVENGTSGDGKDGTTGSGGTEEKKNHMKQKKDIMMIQSLLL